MGVMPTSKVGKIEFCENHITPWTTNAVAIGTTAGAVTALGTLTTAARAAFNAQQVAFDAARDATNNFNLAVAAMNNAAVDIIKQVRAKAATAGNGVYSLASIPVPATPSPIAPPGQPFEFKVILDSSGALQLKWKCNNPAGSTGTIYQVWRRIGGSGEFIYQGGTGTRDFIDATVPAGSAQVTYQIQGVRSTTVGPWAQFNVNFGVSGGAGGGMMIASVTEGKPAKIAA